MTVRPKLTIPLSDEESSVSSGSDAGDCEIGTEFQVKHSVGAVNTNPAQSRPHTRLLQVSRLHKGHTL